MLRQGRRVSRKDAKIGAKAAQQPCKEKRIAGCDEPPKGRIDHDGAEPQQEARRRRKPDESHLSRPASLRPLRRSLRLCAKFFLRDLAADGACTKNNTLWPHYPVFAFFRRSAYYDPVVLPSVEDMYFPAPVAASLTTLVSRDSECPHARQT